jgi:hypothetical protein
MEDGRENKLATAAILARESRMAKGVSNLRQR